MTPKKIIYIVLGCLGLGIGAVGAVVPLLPSFPFLLLAAWCFARSSERLHTWFINTELYRKNLESFMNGRGMTKKAKFRILGTVSAVMLFGFIMMSKVPVGRWILAFVWIAHVIYFIWGIKTISDEEDLRNREEIERMRREKKDEETA